MVRRGKYNNHPLVVTLADGTLARFDSKREMERYQELRLLEIAGEITELRLQPKITLQPAFRYQGVAVRAIVYKPDFAYRDAQGILVYEDVKGGKATRTPAFELKWKMLQYELRHMPAVRLLITDK